MPRNSFLKLIERYACICFDIDWIYSIVSDPEPELEEEKKAVKNIADESQENDSNKITKGGLDQDPGDNVEEEKEISEPESKDHKVTLDTKNISGDLQDVNETNESNENKEELETQNSSEDKPAEPSPNVDDAAPDVKNSKSATDKPSSPLWTESKLRKEWRKFNLDLSPKVQKLNEVIYDIHVHTVHPMF